MKAQEKLHNLISKIQTYITDDSDSVWTSYDSPQELREELEEAKQQLKNNDSRCLEQLNILFAPTGSLQEHSLSNGWSKEFIQLATEFDTLHDTLKNKAIPSRHFKQSILQIWKSILNFLFPPLCVVCQKRLLESEEHICIECLSSLPRTDYHNQEENRLEEFLGGKFIFNRAAAFCYFYKSGGLQKIVHEFKYKNNPELAFYMGKLYGTELKDSDFLHNIDYLIPIPLHPKRQKKRGYNQAEEICKGISQATGIPVCTSAISRTVNNPSQTKHSRIERWENVKDIFATTNNPSLKDKNILLVDDVITTGSTIEALAKCFSKDELPIINVAAIGMAM